MLHGILHWMVRWGIPYNSLWHVSQGQYSSSGNFTWIFLPLVPGLYHSLEPTWACLCTVVPMRLVRWLKPWDTEVVLREALLSLVVSNGTCVAALLSQIPETCSRSLIHFPLGVLCCEFFWLVDSPSPLAIWFHLHVPEHFLALPDIWRNRFNIGGRTAPTPPLLAPECFYSHCVFFYQHYPFALDMYASAGSYIYFMFPSQKSINYMFFYYWSSTILWNSSLPFVFICFFPSVLWVWVQQPQFGNQSSNKTSLLINVGAWLLLNFFPPIFVCKKGTKALWSQSKSYKCHKLDPYL